MDLCVGSVFYLFNGEIIPPNHKFCICVVVDPNMFLCINSENRAMYSSIPIYKKDNPYLKHDSYISCGRVFHFSPEKLRDARPVGNMSYKDLKRLCEHIETVKTFSVQEKSLILKSLSEELENYI